MSLRTIAAARQKEMNDSMTVVAITTLGVMFGLALPICNRILSFCLRCGKTRSNLPAGHLRTWNGKSAVSCVGPPLVKSAPRFIREETHEELGFIRLAWKRDIRSVGGPDY
jgi:hypothetical protein